MIETSQHNIRNDLGFKNNGQLNDSMFNQLWLKKFNESKWWVSNQSQKHQADENTHNASLNRVSEELVKGSLNPLLKNEFKAQHLVSTTNLPLNATKAVDSNPQNVAQLNKAEANMASAQTSLRAEGASVRYTSFSKVNLVMSPIYKYLFIKDNNEIAIRVYDSNDAKTLNISAMKMVEIDEAYIKQIKTILNDGGLDIAKVIVNGKVISQAAKNVELGFVNDNVLDKRY